MLTCDSFGRLLTKTLINAIAEHLLKSSHNEIGQKHAKGWHSLRLPRP